MRCIGIVCLSIVLAQGCSARPSFETAHIRIRDHEFSVELAVTAEQHAYGLMNRKNIAENHGMLFLFPEERIRRFWMKNTLIDLHIAFIDAAYFIVDIQSMRANTLETHKSRRPARYALEVKQGVFSDKGIQIGDRVEFLFAVEDYNVR